MAATLSQGLKGAQNLALVGNWCVGGGEGEAKHQSEQEDLRP